MVRGATQPHLDFLQAVEQLARGKGRSDLRHRVEEAPTFDALLGGRLEEGGDSGEGGAGQEVEPVQGRPAMRRAISQVGTDPDERPDANGSVISTDTLPTTPGSAGDGFVARTVTRGT